MNRLPFHLTVAVLSLAVPASAQTKVPLSCQGFGDRVSELRIEVFPSTSIPADVESLVVELEPAEVRFGYVPPVELGKDKKQWYGRSASRFRFQDVFLRPKLDGFRFSPPESCRYERVITAPDVEECGAWYRVRAQRQVEFQVDPPASAFRIFHHPLPQAGNGCSPDPNPGDEKTAAAVRAELDKVTGLRGFAIEVEVRQGIVHLAGRVSRAARQQALAAVAKKWRRVDDGALEVSNLSGTSLISAGEKTVVEVDIDGKPLPVPFDIDWAEVASPRGWRVDLDRLQDAIKAAVENQKRAGRAQILGQTLSDKLAASVPSFKSITIKRSTW